jgi:major membrane immunogen (membrane-anchored lipoprotein)
MKLLMVPLSVIALLLCLTACGGGSSEAAPTYKDGTYTAQSSPDDEGSYADITVTVAGGRITACEFVTWEKDGTVKGEDYGKVGGVIANRSYYEKAQVAVEAMSDYARQLVSTGDPLRVDAISGATISYDQFVESAREALRGAQ